MTARVCPVHGEWSATGICRWCEPEPTFLDIAKRWQAKHPVLPQVEFLTQTNPFASEEPRVWNFYGFDTDGTIIHDWWEEIRLNEQHAALRWERVARRWNYKHRSQNGLDEEGRATVWRYWVAMQVPP